MVLLSLDGMSKTPGDAPFLGRSPPAWTRGRRSASGSGTTRAPLRTSTSGRGRSSHTRPANRAGATSRSGTSGPRKCSPVAHFGTGLKWAITPGVTCGACAGCPPAFRTARAVSCRPPGSGRIPRSAGRGCCRATEAPLPAPAAAVKLRPAGRAHRARGAAADLQRLAQPLLFSDQIAPCFIHVPLERQEKGTPSSGIAPSVPRARSGR